MRRNTGAILRDTRPETIIMSACRGEARKTSEPKRARSLRPLVAFIISIAQHASPKVAGHSDDFRAQLISESRLVVRTSGSASAKTFSKPITWYAHLRRARFARLRRAHSQVKPLLTNPKSQFGNLKPGFPTAALRPQLHGARFRSSQMRPS